MKTETIPIIGMGCDHCVSAVERELSKIPDLKVRKVVIGTADVEFDETRVSQQQIEEAIQRAGYSIDRNS